MKNLELFEPLAVGSSLSDTNYTHSFFPYPAKFPPEPIREFLNRFSKVGESVLDPFCGSGTVLVEALLAERRAVGIELNPVAALVSRAKAVVYCSEHLEELKSFLKELGSAQLNRDRWIDDSISPEDLPSYKNIDLWFKPNMLQELTAIRKNFLYKMTYSPEVRDLLWMAFLRIIVPVSNQEGETRYASIEKPELVNGYALTRMRVTVSAYFKALQGSTLLGLKREPATIINKDALVGLDAIPDSSIDLVITSPPYINSFDYYLYHKHRIFWMNENPQAVRRQEIGCHHRIDTKSFDVALDEYSGYLLEVLQKAHSKLKTGGHFVMLVGDGIVKKQTIRADHLLDELAERSGYKVDEIRTIALREVSRGFIKDHRIDKKQHHAIVLSR